MGALKKRKRDKITKFKKKITTCFWCKKQIKKVLDLEATNADLCSFECERAYWLDVLY